MLFVTANLIYAPTVESQSSAYGKLGDVYTPLHAAVAFFKGVFRRTGNNMTSSCPTSLRLRADASQANQEGRTHDYVAALDALNDHIRECSVCNPQGAANRAQRMALMRAREAAEDYTEH